MQAARPFVSAFYFGKIRYKKALNLQHNLVNWIKTKPDVSKPTLLLLQHYPVYTIGLRQKDYTYEEINYLESLGADFVKTNRGGLITFHGPGQLVAYPVFSRTQIPINVKNYICLLEQVIINICTRYNLTAGRSVHTGVWVGDNKICAMGINAQQRTYSHGLALNCNTDMQWFKRITPCGILDKGVTSLSLQTKNDVTVDDVIPLFLEEMSSVFHWEISELHHVLEHENLDDESLLEKITDTARNSKTGNDVKSLKKT